MIKKTILFCAFLLTMNGVLAQKNIIKAAALFGNTGVQYERALTDHISLVGQIGYSSFTVGSNSTESKTNGLGYYFEGRYYFSSKKDVMEGWHIGPYFNRLETKDNNDLETNVSFYGATSGYQWIFKSDITLELIFGLGALDIKSDVDDFDIFNGLPVFPHLGITFGYSF